MVSGSISLPFRGTFHLSLTVHWFTIGKMVVFRLTKWSWQIPTKFHVFRRTQDTLSRLMHFIYGGITLYATTSQWFLLYINFVTLTKVLQPHPVEWFGLFRFRSPLLTESLLFSFPLGTKMFQFPRFPSYKL